MEKHSGTFEQDHSIKSLQHGGITWEVQLSENRSYFIRILAVRKQWLNCG